MRNKNFSIVIQYKLDNESTWIVNNINPDDYFDLDDNELLEVDSVPIYNHAIDYIKDQSEKISCTKIIITDENMRKKRIITTTYWNKQNNSITERVDFDNQSCDYEIIIGIKVQNDPSVYEVLRVIKDDNTLKPIYHGIFADRKDGSQKETRIL